MRCFSSTGLPAARGIAIRVHHFAGQAPEKQESHGEVEEQMLKLRTDVLRHEGADRAAVGVSGSHTVADVGGCVPTPGNKCVMKLTQTIVAMREEF